MKKLIMAVAMLAVTGTAAAKPSMSDAKQVGEYCKTFSKATTNVYILKESGFDKRYMVQALLDQGHSKDLVEAVTDTAYELKSGLPASYVQQGVKKFCISAVTEGQMK